jgi:hypothetical protein
MIRRVFKWLGIGLLVLVAVAGVAWAANAAYMQRYLRMAVSQARGESQRADWYEPVDKVPGAARVVPLPVAATPVVSATALAAADAYARETKAQGLVVWQGGSVQAAKF